MREGFIYHKIEKGDTLKSIADKYGISVIRLTRMNSGIRNDQSLKIGSFLIIGDIGKDTERVQANEKYEQDQAKKEQDAAKLPEQWLTEEEIAKMALENVGEYALDSNLKMAKDRALEKLEESKIAADADFESDKLKLEQGAREDKEDFRQDAIRQGIGRSSIVKSIEDQIDTKAQNKLGELEEKKQIKDMQNTSQGEYILDKYRLDVDDAKKKYEQALKDEQDRIRLKNQQANLDVLASNGIIGDERQYQVADKLLSTLTKKQAADYLVRNEEALRRLWGGDAIEKLNKKYR